MSIVIGGAAAYFWVLTVVWVLAGQPALTATALAWACSLAFVPWAAVVVLVTGDLRGHRSVVVARDEEGDAHDRPGHDDAR